MHTHFAYLCAFTQGVGKRQRVAVREVEKREETPDPSPNALPHTDTNGARVSEREIAREREREERERESEE